MTAAEPVTAAAAGSASAVAEARRPLLEIRQLSVDFGGLNALDRLDLQTGRVILDDTADNLRANPDLRASYLGQADT